MARERPAAAGNVKAATRSYLEAEDATAAWIDEGSDARCNTPRRFGIGRIETSGVLPCAVRKVNMAISLAFLAPDLVKAAIDGRLPHGMGVARLADLPAEWSRQHQMLGLPSQ